MVSARKNPTHHFQKPVSGGDFIVQISDQGLTIRSHREHGKIQGTKTADQQPFAHRLVLRGHVGTRNRQTIGAEHGDKNMAEGEQGRGDANGLYGREKS